jgi:serine/threonine-protein kinase
MTSAILTAPVYPVIVGRYALFDPIASGGMASVHLGRLLGSFGFARTVAIKRLHRDMALNPEFLAMFLDEARLAARVRHTNVVQTLDVVALQEELLLVMEYISGAALSTVVAAERRAGHHTPHRIAVDIMIGVLSGLHAAHEAKDESGEPLHIVHRDVSPQNILVGADGVARLLDFGIAKAVGATPRTRPNQIKGKLRYLAPENIMRQGVSRASDIYAASVVLWEMLAGRRLFDGARTSDVVRQIIGGKVASPRSVRPRLPGILDEIVMRGLDRDPARRFATAQEMALALESAVAPASRSAISGWVFANVGDEIRERDRRVAQIEREAQSEGAGAAQRLQAGRALSAEAPVDKRTRHPATDSGATPVSVETTVPDPRHPGRFRSRSALLGGLLALLFATAIGSWRLAGLHRSGRPLATLSAAVGAPHPMSILAVASASSVMESIGRDTAPLSPDDSAATLGEASAVANPVPAPILTPASAPSAVPPHRHGVRIRPPVRRAPQKNQLSDRIYRRD